MSSTEATDVDVIGKTDKTEEAMGMPSENIGADSRRSSQVKPGSGSAEPAESAEVKPNKESSSESNHRPTDKPDKELETLTS